jgi:hypothetical protein
VEKGQPWPPLPYAEWKDTYATLHMWTQVVGKIALARGPRLNHSWGSALQVGSRGLATRPLRHGTRTFTMLFDFVRHALVIETSDGDARVLPLVPRSVAAFHGDVLATLRDMGLPVKLWPMPVEIPEPVRFDQDDGHRSYDREYVSRFWRILVQVERVLGDCRATFLGKCSPVHFFWGSFDLAVTRFSGRPAPPREGPAFMREAYSHEVISHGFWPGGPPLPEPVFYAYAAPVPAGLANATVRPETAYYHRELGEFILPYAKMRRAARPEDAIREFVESTYAAAADLAKWDRATLEVGTGTNKS